MSRPSHFNKPLVAALLVVLAAGTAVGLPLYRRASQLEHLVAVSWGDGRYGKAFYGAYVFYEAQENGQLRVQLAVRIDRGTPWSHYAHDPRPLGLASDAADAVRQWGVITWSDAGLHVGPAAAQGYLMPRAELENHR